MIYKQQISTIRINYSKIYLNYHKTMKSHRKQYFKMSSFLLLLVITAWISIQWYSFLLNKNIEDQNKTIKEQNIKLEKYKSLTWFTKLMAVKELEWKYDEVPRSTHINKVITMLQEIKNLDQRNDETILLSDFNVDLQKISVKWQVSDLKLLYYSNSERGIISLIDRFKNLDFIENLYIKNYTKDKDAIFFSFILEANVIKDAK